MHLWHMMRWSVSWIWKGSKFVISLKCTRAFVLLQQFSFLFEMFPFILLKMVAQNVCVVNPSKSTHCWLVSCPKHENILDIILERKKIQVFLCFGGMLCWQFLSASMTVVIGMHKLPHLSFQQLMYYYIWRMLDNLWNKKYNHIKSVKKIAI